jgi:L-alanine-DL-glutamate epimerase-like enolase superfamily enzyme
MSNCEIIESKPHLLGISLEKPFPLGFGSLQHLPRVIYEISVLEKKGLVMGIGEASIDFPFSTYDAYDIYWALSQVDLAGKNPEERDSILTNASLRRSVLQEFPAAFTALNMALDDLVGQLEAKSVLDIYGAKREGGYALASIAFQGETALLIEEIEGKFRNGFVPKPKVGRGVDEDFDTIKAVSGYCEQRRIPFVLDFNAQYDPEAFGQLLERLASFGVPLSQLLFIEQPTREDAGIEGLSFVRELLQSAGLIIPVMADESFVTVDDALACSRQGIALNFKLHKVGGIYYAREIEQRVLELNTGTQGMVGGTFPTAIGRTYDQQGAAILETTVLPGDGWEPSTDWFQGEKHLIAQDFPRKNGKFSPIRGKGLGITPEWSKIRAFEIDDPRMEYRQIRKNRAGKRIGIELKPGQSYSDKYRERTGKNPDWNL